jgi:hypothetical protein
MVPQKLKDKFYRTTIQPAMLYGVECWPTVGALRTGYPHIQASSQDKEQDMHPRTATYPVAPDLASLLRWPPTLPRVPRPWTSPPYRGGLRRCTNVTENQFGFMPGRSTMEAIYLIGQLMERCREQKKDYIWSLLTWRRHMTKCLGMSCGGLCRSTKSQQSTLPSLSICTIML